MMRWKLALVAVLVLPLAASADGLFKKHGCSTCDGGKGGGLHGHGGGAPTDGFGLGLFQRPFQAAPWYLYWPYDQHFQMPAPINAPYYAPQAYGNPALNPYFAPAASVPVVPAPLPPK